VEAAAAAEGAAARARSCRRFVMPLAISPPGACSEAGSRCAPVLWRACAFALALPHSHTIGLAYGVERLCA